MYFIKLLKTSISILVITSMLAGCASTGVYTSPLPKPGSTLKTPVTFFDQHLLKYDRDLRVYRYNNLLVRNELGKKISNREEAIARLEMSNFEPTPNLSSALLRGTGFALLLPAYIIGGVIMIPLVVLALPGAALQILGNTEQIDLVRNYRMGIEAQKKGEFEEARALFFGVIERDGSLIFHSDVHYRIAKTFDAENRAHLATTYYNYFLEYSESNSPEQFAKHDGMFVVDIEHLADAFDDAESRIELLQSSDLTDKSESGIKSASLKQSIAHIPSTPPSP